MPPLHFAFIFQGNGEISWATKIAQPGSDDWGVRTFGTPMEVALPLTGREVARFKASMKRRGLRASSAPVSEYGLSVWARGMRPDTRD